MNITVYCGANLGNQQVYQQATVDLAKWIAKCGTLVYGGGNAGLMGLLADTVLAEGGKVIGVMPTFLQQRELAHQGLTELILVESMAERKAKMLALANVCIALPGGPGTLEEITEVYSWARIGKNTAPCICFNANGFYDPLQTLYRQMCESGFLTQADFDKLLFSQDFTEIEHFIQDYEPPMVRKY
ncbi:MAG: TIGR00730 family Rossman fold protein [Pasteurellaceae bacterium]|nr:TIGR00730 family Rossman fold protein [Pasteurellaceae bacterium]